MICRPPLPLRRRPIAAFDRPCHSKGRRWGEHDGARGSDDQGHAHDDHTGHRDLTAPAAAANLPRPVLSVTFTCPTICCLEIVAAPTVRYGVLRPKSAYHPFGLPFCDLTTLSIGTPKTTDAGKTLIAKGWGSTSAIMTFEIGHWLPTVGLGGH